MERESIEINEGEIEHGVWASETNNEGKKKERIKNEIGCLVIFHLLLGDKLTA